MHPRPFAQVDVFTRVPYRGNPLGVVLDGQGLSTETMQDFTNWTNLSECTFVLPPSPEAAAQGADYRVRIFCPGRELPFAGHPTLGTCHAWLAAGGQPRGAHVVQECGVGLVRIRRDGTRLAFAAPPLRRSGPLDDDTLQLLLRGLGLVREEVLAHAWCDNGPGWRGLLLRDAQRVLDLKPDAAVLAGLDIGVAAAWAPGARQDADGAPIAFEVRAFFPGNAGLAEDPVTGSLNAALAQWLMAAGVAPARYLAAQGTAMGRAGRVHVERVGTDIWVGGDSVTCVEGAVRLA